MTDDAAHALGDLETRAEGLPGTDPRDRISLRDYVIEADIGAFQQERGQRQRLRFNVVVETRPHPAHLSDDVDRILSYDRITEAIDAALADDRLNLLETLAERVADRVLAEPQARRAFVRVEKLDRGPGALGVEIVRSCRDGAIIAQDEAVLHPLVVHLDNATIAAPDLAARLDALEARGHALILTVGPPDLPRPATGHAPTQRRIDLLAVEQNAWALAARDLRCVVVSSWTELDWAVRHRRTSVWAPSKLVLDAVDSPKTQDPLTLALWLAESVAATRLVVHGPVTIPAGTRVPVDHA